MSMSVDGAFIYFTIPFFGGIPITQTTVSHLIVTIFLCTACIVLGKRLTKRPNGVQVMVEKGVMMVRNMVVETMGEHNAHWTPFIATIFLSSICGSFIGLTGFLRSSTADLSCTLVWALMVTAIIWYHNIKNNGFLGWLKGFTEPIVVMTPMNVISEIAQPVSMAFRHFGNIAGGGSYYDLDLHLPKPCLCGGFEPDFRQWPGGIYCVAGCWCRTAGLAQEEAQCSQADFWHSLRGSWRVWPIGSI